MICPICNAECEYDEVYTNGSYSEILGCFMCEVVENVEDDDV